MFVFRLGRQDFLNERPVNIPVHERLVLSADSFKCRAVFSIGIGTRQIPTSCVRHSNAPSVAKGIERQHGPTFSLVRTGCLAPQTQLRLLPMEG